MMIGIESTRANKPQKTGVEWYAWHVIQELKKLTVGNPHSWILYSNAVLTNGLEQLPENWYEVRLPWMLPYGWTQLRLSFELYRHPIDVMWFPGSTLPRILPKKSVVTVHDIGFHRFPELYPARQRAVHERAMKEIRSRATRILTVSEYSAREIADAYGIDPQRIAITPCGIDHDVYHPITDSAVVEDCLRRYQLAAPYFVYVGRIEKKKNVTTLIKAFTEFKARRGVGDPHRLVLIGSHGFGFEEVQRAIDQSPARPDIVQLGYVPEQDLPAILQTAEALIQPSWIEGFGIPPVQAMACGCPVISSTGGSLPEICGDAAIYFAPSEPQELVQQLSRLVDDTVLHQQMRDAGIAQAAKYTWQRTAELTLPALMQWN